MVNIRFQDGKTYSIETRKEEMQYVENGDRHGNSNFRLHAAYLSTYEVIQSIAPAIAEEVIAVKLNEKTVSLQTPVSRDGTLRIVFPTEGEGYAIAVRTVALLAMETLASIDLENNLKSLTVNEDGVILESYHSCEAGQSIFPDKLMALMEENHPLFRQEKWQKNVLLDKWGGSIPNRFFETILECYDEYEIIPTVSHNETLFPIMENEIYAMFPRPAKSIVEKITFENAMIRIRCRRDSGKGN